MGRGVSKSGGGGGGGASKLNAGEEAYVKTTPTSLHKDGQVLVAKNNDGEYIYKGGFDRSNGAIDKESYAYRDGLQENNVRAKFGSDGSVTVSNGGLYSRKKTFKSVDEFQKDANSRIDANINYYNRNMQATKQGRITQLEAENLRSMYRNNGTQGIKTFNKQLHESIVRENNRISAANEMKARLNTNISNAKKRLRK